MNSCIAQLTKLTCLALAVTGCGVAQAQDLQPESLTSESPWQVTDVLQNLKQETAEIPADPDPEVWWTPYVTQPVNPEAEVVPVNVGDLMVVALEYSAKINVARTLPQIRETAITAADAAFDWNMFVDSRWDDRSEPVGSSLTVGLGGTRFRDHQFSMDAGLRRKLFSGAEFYTFQRVGHQNSNSSFFVPNDQATSRIALGFTQPLLRGGGKPYNTSLILLAEIDTGSANDEFHRQLQAHLLEVARGYWSLYLERANLAQRVSLYLKTRTIAEQLQSRANIDAQQSQIISANAALESRRSDLIRSVAAVKNAETRLRALLNAPALDASVPELLELIPTEPPSTVRFVPELPIEFEMAMQNRPEVAAAIKAIRASCVRLRMADHEILPTLNFITETYVSGLRGQSDIGNAWADQFRIGEPSYSIGLEFEVPLGRRAAFANRHRREVEVYQLREQYRGTLELVRAEVEVAVREVRTSWRELGARNRSRLAAQAEAAAQEARWEQLGDRTGTGGLLLESLLAAQERVTQAEYDYAKAQMTYNLALINLRHANGTLLQLQPIAADGTGLPNAPLPVEEFEAEEPLQDIAVPVHEEAGATRVIHPSVAQSAQRQPVLEIPGSMDDVVYPLENIDAAAGLQIEQDTMPEPQPTPAPPVENTAKTEGGKVWK